jgi:hypothetical protein
MQGIVIETREAHPGLYRAEVAEGPAWARGYRIDRTSRGEAYNDLCHTLRTIRVGGVDFIHVPE